MTHPPRTLNPAQRLLVAPSFVYVVLAYVAVLGVVDVVLMVRDLARTPWAAIGHPSTIATRLVVAGVFFELRPNFVKHLLGEEAARRDPRDAHLSESCEIYGGYLTVAGLFVELVESTRELLHGLRVVNPVATVMVLVLSLLSLHVMLDMVRGLRHAPSRA